jgi:hypothetical protein
VDRASGQIQPQTTRPKKRVITIVSADQTKAAKRARAAMAVTRASSGSKWNMASTLPI